jgi:poly-gamma-glutamate capsule biosynthesis protein CapA/YwtB (metallophosphatase superfamily)
VLKQKPVVFHMTPFYGSRRDDKDPDFECQAILKTLKEMKLNTGVASYNSEHIDRNTKGPPQGTEVALMGHYLSLKIRIIHFYTNTILIGLAMPQRLFAIIAFFLILLAPAVILAKRPVSKNPEAEKAYRAGIHYMLKHHYTTAESHMLKAIQLDPRNGKIHWETGWVYWQMKNWSRVIEYWEKTLLFTPEQKDLKKFLTLAYQYQRWEETSDTANKVQSVASGSFSSKPGQITLVATGDIMMGSDYNPKKKLPKNNGANLFDNVKGYLKGDLVFGNLEGPLTQVKHSDKCKPGKKCYAFRTPPSYSSNLRKAGYNVVNLANNHTLDFGLEGLTETQEALADKNIFYFGSADKPYIITETNGVKVAFIGVATTYCCVHIDQIDKTSRWVRMLKEKADLVVVSFHAGAEGLDAAHTPEGSEYYFGENRGDVRKFSHAMINAGADLLLGHGPHSLRGMEQYKGKLIAYSLGNFVGYLGFSTSGHLQYSLILRVTLDLNGNLLETKITPIIFSPRVIPKYDPKGRAIILLNDLGAADFKANAVQFDRFGYGKLQE